MSKTNHSPIILRLMSRLNQIPRVTSAVPRRRDDEVCFRQRRPQFFVLKRNRSAAAIFLRDHAVDVADADPIGIDGDAPLGMVMGFGPCPGRAESAQVDVLDVEGLVDAVAVESRRDFSAYPGFHIHVRAERRADQVVPEIFASFAVFCDYFEVESAARAAF